MYATSKQLKRWWKLGGRLGSLKAWAHKNMPADYAAWMKRKAQG